MNFCLVFMMDFWHYPAGIEINNKKNERIKTAHGYDQIRIPTDDEKLHSFGKAVSNSSGSRKKDSKQTVLLF